MEIDEKKGMCPKIDVDGVISAGKQFDLDITLPEDNRDVIYGVVKNCFKEPVTDAVVKLVEIYYEKGKEERRPIGHTFTDKDGEFVFGPLCPDKSYEIQIWVDRVKHVKICKECKRQGKCLKGDKHDKCDCFLEKLDYDKDDWDKDDWGKKDCDKYDHDKKNEYDDCDRCDSKEL